MSYYMEQLQKKGLALNHEQKVTRNALKYACKPPSVRKNKLNAKMDEEIARMIAKGKI